MAKANERKQNETGGATVKSLAIVPFRSLRRGKADGKSAAIADQIGIGLAGALAEGSLRETTNGDAPTKIMR